MTDDAPFDDIPSLYFLVDQAAEAMRQANHHTYTAREVSDLYSVLGACHALFSRFDQLAAYLLATVAQADAADYRHDDHGDVTLTLTAIQEGLTAARGHTAHTVRAVDRAWQELSHLASAPQRLICPECGDHAYRGIPTDLTPAQRWTPVRPRHRHADGTQLCPVIGEHGYEPATPVRPDTADPRTTGTTDPQ